MHFSFAPPDDEHYFDGGLAQVCTCTHKGVTKALKECVGALELVRTKLAAKQGPGGTPRDVLFRVLACDFIVGCVSDQNDTDITKGKSCASLYQSPKLNLNTEEVAFRTARPKNTHRF